MNLKPLRLFFHNDDISEMFPNFTNKATYTHTMTDLYRNSKIIVIIYMQKTNIPRLLEFGPITNNCQEVK